MKSAYELAMERLEKTAPTIKLTDKQKAEIAEIDSLCKARIAEKEVFLGDQIVKAQAKGEFEEVDQIKKQLASEIRRIEADAESQKAKVRSGPQI